MGFYLGTAPAAAFIWLHSPKLRCRGTDSKNGAIDLSDWIFLSGATSPWTGTGRFTGTHFYHRVDLAAVCRPVIMPCPPAGRSNKALSLPAHGIATYRLAVKTNASAGLYSIFIPNVYTDYALWVNGALLHACGSFAQTQSVYLHPQAYDFYYSGSELEIVLQLKNDALVYGGGVGQSIRLGTAEQIHQEYQVLAAVDLSLISVCLFVCFFFLVLYYYKKGQPRACVACCSLLFGLRTQSAFEYDVDNAGFSGTSVLAWLEASHADDPVHHYFHAVLYAPAL
jgi:hypothetical protein